MQVSTYRIYADKRKFRIFKIIHLHLDQTVCYVYAGKRKLYHVYHGWGVRKGIRLTNPKYCLGAEQSWRE